MSKDKRRFLVSDESKNVYGLRLKSDGGDFGQFRKNPVMLYNHDEDRPPIGRWTELKTGDGGKITAEAEFDGKDEFARKIEDKVDDGYIRMASVGVIPQEIEGEWVTKWTLREISVVPFGGNQNAFVLYDDKGNVMNLSAVTEKFDLKNNKRQMSDEKTNTLKVTLVAGLELSDGASDGEVIKSVLKLNADNVKMKAELETLKAEKAEAKKALELKDREALVDKAIADRKITAGSKETYMKLSDADLKNIFETMPAVVNLGDVPQGGGDGNPGAPEGAKNMGFAELSQKHPDYLEKLKLNDSARFNALYKAEYGVEPKSA
ncbi:hypothetical protein FUAX_40910 (plasmid) [Fulvitalea axinellae]|uniref:Caudovirus prohead protease n=1 Tax=Fulvitalea axinellae TaxID=1182444 RepID=A0AAU9DAS7_9BACT|nr:hypothetical protein FUAX_40910 [Fulvitalea axinellae]